MPPLLGEEYAPSLLVPEEHQLRKSGSRKRSQQAITSERLDVWRQDLTTGQVAQIEWVLGPGHQEFGYSREAPPASPMTVCVAQAMRDLDTLPLCGTDQDREIGPLGAPEDLAKTRLTQDAIASGMLNWCCTRRL